MYSSSVTHELPLVHNSLGTNSGTSAARSPTDGKRSPHTSSRGSEEGRYIENSLTSVPGIVASTATHIAGSHYYPGNTEADARVLSYI